MRTNIVIEDALMEEAIVLSGNKTKKETVEQALRLMVQILRQSSIRSFRGKISWEGDLASMRKDS